jgi:hypothetical protein
VAPERLDGYVTRGARPREDGSFEIPRLAPGTYQITARHFQTGGVEYWGTAEIAVNGGDLDGVAIPMRAGAIVRGRVHTENGDPVGVPVMVSLRTDDTTRAPQPRPVRTYSDGSFRLEGAFGAQHVRAVEARMIPGSEAPGINVRALQEVTPATRPLTTWWLKSITLNGRDVTDEPIDFSRGDVMLDITMTNRMASVRGSVAWNRTASRRRPSVIIFPDDDTRWMRGSRAIGRPKWTKPAASTCAACRRAIGTGRGGGRRGALVLAQPEMLQALRAARHAAPHRRGRHARAGTHCGAPPAALTARRRAQASQRSVHA